MNFPDTYDNKISAWLYPLLLLGCGIVFFSRLPQHMDILFSDEGNYLLIARNMFEHTDMSFGPLYSLWLKAWGGIFRDPIQLYYINYTALSVIVPILLYFLLRRLSFSAEAAFFASLSFLYAAANVTMWPRVSHFGLMILLSGLLLAMRSKTKAVFLQGMALTLLVSSYARAEFLGLSVLFFLLSFYFIWKERLQLQKIRTGVLLVLFAVILLIFKTPENNYEETGNYTRSFTAFIQHYYLGLTFEGKQFDYWWLSIKDFYYEGEFAACQGSLMKFIQLYPGQFFHHIFFDIKMYLLQATTKLLLITNPLFNKISPRNLMISAALIVSAWGLFITNGRTRAHILTIIKKNRFPFLILFILILPSLAACIIILPRDHYVFIQAPFFILLTGLYAEIIFIRLPKLRFLLVPLALFCLVYQNPGKFTFIKAGTNADTHTNVQLIEFLRDSLPADRSYQLFSDNIFITGFLPERFTEPTLMEYSFDFKNLDQFFADKKVNLILVTPETHREPYLRRDSTWNQFLKDPATIGFKRIPAGRLDSTFQLYVK